MEKIINLTKFHIFFNIQGAVLKTFNQDEKSRSVILKKSSEVRVNLIGQQKLQINSPEYEYESGPKKYFLG